MSEEWKKIYNERAVKHNKRVKSIREVRLPKSCTTAIDGAIQAMDSLHFSIIESICNNHNCVTMDDMIQLGSALDKMKEEFQERELK